MFLHRLNSVERSAFLELAHHVANANGIMDEEEWKMIELYGVEMGLQVNLGALSQSRPIDSVIQSFAGSEVKRAVFIEAVAIAHADGSYDAEEQEMIGRIREAFGLSDEYYANVKKWLHSYRAICAEGLDLAE